MRENVTVFKGRKVDMRPHYLDEDSWELVKHGTREQISRIINSCSRPLKRMSSYMTF